jgi:hypothetical protein
MEYFVSPGGDDANPGSEDRPFGTVGQGISVLRAGDVLNLRHGVYVGQVEITDKHGTARDPIVIRSYPGETAYIDGCVAFFRRRGSEDWVRGRQLDGDAVEDEYISAMTFTERLVNRGAFLDRNPYTRLVTYSNINDLRASNETFDQITGGDPRPGPAVTDRDGNPLGHRLPWVYMGPGLYFNGETRRIHIRLAHTHNTLPGVIDYDEETDPRLVPLAISPHDMVALRIAGSSLVRLERLTIGHGGDNTILIQQVQGLTLDHVRIRAGTRAVRMGGCTRAVLAHCRFQGGVPTWMYRTDRTAGYFFRSDDGAVVQNNLGEKTSEALLLGNANNSSIEIHHCEFRNGHKVFLNGQDVEFHHNWLNNLQEDGLALGFDGGTEASVTTIHDNVVQRVSRGFSFGLGNAATQWHIYRNLIDLRGPVRATRPRHPGDGDVLRSGQFHAGSPGPIGPHDIFQNTIVTRDQRGAASFLHYREASGPHRRRCFNNIFVAVNPTPEADRAVTFVPSPAFPGPTDGNLYHRVGHATRDAFRSGVATFAGLEELHASELFEQSKTQYAPGYEARSVVADPLFRDSDDLRLDERSPALAAGIRLPADLAALDPWHPLRGRPDIGCYPGGAPPMHVGVDGCRTFPDLGPVPVARPKRLGSGPWTPVFLHQFPDGDPANLTAVPGELTVVPDGTVIRPTPEPADLGLLMAPGNRLLSYRFAQPFDDVIGVDVTVDIVYPEPNPFSDAVVPMVALNPGALTLALGRIPPPEPDVLAARIVLNVGGDALAFSGATLPPFPTQRTTRFRARWHTHGRAHLWHDGVLRAYRPGVAAGRTLTIGELVVGIPSEVPRFFPRYRVRRVLLKVLRREETQRRLAGRIPLDMGCQPPVDCAEDVHAVVGDMHTRLRTFLAGVFSAMGTSPQATALQSAGAGAARAFSTFVESGGTEPVSTFVARVGDFADLLAATDPAGFAALIADLTRRGENIDPACRRSFDPLLRANAANLQPLVSILDTAWRRVLDTQPGG